MSEGKESSAKNHEFKYLSNQSQMPPELYDWEPVQQQGFKEKFIRKIKENPFVPIGCGATVVALTVGLVQFNRGKTKNSQLMMRFRVGAQAFTIGAILIGVAFQATKGNKKYPT